MDTWADVAVRELEVELKRLDLDADAKRAGLERLQADYDAVIAEQATVRGMLDWTRKKQAAESASAESAESTVTADLNGHGTLAAVAPAAVQPEEAEPEAQTELCIKVLTQLGRPAETAEIRRHLEQAGYTLNQTQVRSALKYMAAKKNPRVQSIRPGLWVLTGASFPAVPALIPAMDGAGGSR
jgi:multidrug resistance efflux pump